MNIYQMFEFDGSLKLAEGCWMPFMVEKLNNY